MNTSIVDIHMKKGIRPEFDIYIGREVRDYKTGKIRYEESIWANPHLTLPEYELYILHCIDEQPELFDLNKLKGKRLGDWCITTDKIEPLVCHGQVLMKLIKEVDTK